MKELEHPKLQEAYLALKKYTEMCKELPSEQHPKEEQLLWALTALLAWAVETERTTKLMGLF